MLTANSANSIYTPRHVESQGVSVTGGELVPPSPHVHLWTT